MLQIRVLGPLEVVAAGSPLVVDTRKALAILALLAVEGRPFARDELAAMLWPESDDESARGALRRTLSVLRTALAHEPESVDGYVQLAMAYGHKGDLAQADLASATAAFMRGDQATARQIAARAKTRFPIGSPGWVKADDIISSKSK